MAEYVYTGTRAWSTVKASQNGDGTGTFWERSFLPLADRVYSLGKAFTASGTPSLTVSLDAYSAVPADPDGTSLVGLGAISGTGWTGGLLRTVMEAMVAMIDTLSNDKVDKGGDTMTGGLAIGSSGSPQNLEVWGTTTLKNTATASAGIVAQNSGNGDGIGTTGAGTGAGIAATGGGASGTGGVFMAGSGNGQGLDVAGTGTGVGATIQGGANGRGALISAGGGNNAGAEISGTGTGAGVKAFAGASNANAVEATATGTGYAVNCLAGGVHFGGSQPASNADPGANMAHGTNQTKAWVNVETTGLGAYVINDAYNVASCSLASTYIEVTFARAFANADYACTVTNGDGTALSPSVDYANSTTGKVRIKLYDIAGTAQNFNTDVLKLAVTIVGRQ